MIELLLSSLIFLTPGCKAENKEYQKWGETGGGIVESESVPDGKAWIIRAAGLATNDYLPGGADYMLELIRPIRSQENKCCWRIPLEKSPRLVSSTPVLALSRMIVMYEGERLAGRTNGSAKFGIYFVYYEVPKACVP